ncbi:MAG: tetratricopeptide repeat protein [Bacteroidetes bacterium]|nr:tetratricopeptide repeat protein [Bacteroidota bacterium]
MSELQTEKHPFLDFVKNNKKGLTYALTALVIGLAGYFGYTEMYQKPREEKAADAMFAAEKYFAMDSSTLVLNGDGSSKGVLYVINQFSGTKAANLAKYYAGVSYYRTNDFNKAIEYLKDFSTSAKQVQAIAYGTIGDAYSELKNTEEAINYYKKAGAHFPEDEAISSEYLYRAAALLELNGKADEAVEIYKNIKSKYPKSEKGLLADKFINKLKVQP